MALDITGAQQIGAIMGGVTGGMSHAGAQAALIYTEVWNRFRTGLVALIEAYEALRKKDESLPPIPDEYNAAKVASDMYGTLLGMCALRQLAELTIRTETRTEALRRMLAGVEAGFGSSGFTAGGYVDYSSISREGHVSDMTLKYVAETMQTGDNWKIVLGTAAPDNLPADLKDAVAALVSAQLTKLGGGEQDPGIIALLPEKVRKNYA